ncbi:MLNS [Symbiodinium sp. CCMP2456]|nr:MLNS [Symbiodinium sp. CCMP2456]
MAEEELSNYRDAGDDLGQGCMLLSMAEAACAYRGSSKRDEAIALLPLDLRWVECAVFKALENAEEALAIFREVKDPKYEGLAALSVAEVYFRKRNFHAARRAAAEATEIFKGIDDKLCQAMSLHMGAATEARAGVLEMAIRLGRKSLKILQESGSKKQQMASLLALGQFYLMREDARLSLSMGEAAMALLQELDDAISWEGVAIGFLVEAYILNNQSEKAVQLCKDALERARPRTDQKRETVYLLHHLIHALSVYGDIDQVLEVSDEALALSTEVGCMRLKAHVYEELSHAHLLAEQNNDALYAAKEAVGLLKDLGADHDEITTRLQVLTKVLIIQDNYQEAHNQIEMAKDIAQKIEEKPLEAFCLSIQSRVQALLGDPEGGVKAADLAIDMFKEDGDRRGECRVWEGLSEIHMTANDFSSALRAAKRAETLCADVGDTRLMARMKHTTSMVHMSADAHDEAKAAITEAIKLSRADDDMRGTVKYIFLAMDIWVTSLTAMDPEDKSKVRIYRQGCEKAMRLAKEGVKLSIRLEDRYAECMANYWVGTMHIMMGRPKEARVNADVSLEIAKSKRDMLSEMYARGLLVQICLQEKDVKSAKENLKDVQALQTSMEPSKSFKVMGFQGLAEELGDPQAKAMADQLKELVLGSGVQEAAPQAAAMAAPTQDFAGVSSAATSEDLAYIAPDPLTIKTHIIAMVKNMVGGGDEVDGDTPLMESGVDSLASVELRTQLQGEFKVNLPSTVMFNYPTIEGLTGLLVDECTQKKITWTG